MKKSVLITTLLLLLAVVAIGCKADDATEETPLTLAERAGVYSNSTSGLDITVTAIGNIRGNVGNINGSFDPTSTETTFSISSDTQIEFTSATTAIFTSADIPTNLTKE